MQARAHVHTPHTTYFLAIFGQHSTVLFVIVLVVALSVGGRIFMSIPSASLSSFLTFAVMIPSIPELSVIVPPLTKEFL